MVKSRWFTFKIKLFYNFPGWLLFYILFFVIGCAPAKIYSINMNYNSGKAVVPAYLKAEEKSSFVITVTEFTDTRKIDDRLVLGYVVEKDGMKKFVLPKYKKPTKAVADGIREYLGKAGYIIPRLREQWDLKEETMPKSDGKIIIGGNIEELDVISKKGFPTDLYESRIKLTLVIADAAQKRIIYRSSVESSSSLEHVSFSEEKMEEQINIVLADAIEKVFENKNIAQKIKEAVVQ